MWLYLGDTKPQGSSFLYPSSAGAVYAAALWGWGPDLRPMLAQLILYRLSHFPTSKHTCFSRKYKHRARRAMQLLEHLPTTHRFLGVDI